MGQKHYFKTIAILLAHNNNNNRLFLQVNASLNAANTFPPLFFFTVLRKEKPCDSLIAHVRSHIKQNLYKKRREKKKGERRNKQKPRTWC
jgi:hypothetical protein